MKLPVLPVYYYHDHFTEMLFFVSEIYGPVLTERHLAFVETFKTLSKDAQCLLIRHHPQGALRPVAGRAGSVQTPR
jgi:DNA polymerase III subunit epsilon